MAAIWNVKSELTIGPKLPPFVSTMEWIMYPCPVGVSF